MGTVLLDTIILPIIMAIALPAVIQRQAGLPDN